MQPGRGGACRWLDGRTSWSVSRVLGSICPVQHVLAPLLAASSPATSHSSSPRGCVLNAPPTLPCLKNQLFVLFFNLFLRCCFELQHLLPGGSVGGLLSPLPSSVSQLYFAQQDKHVCYQHSPGLPGWLCTSYSFANTHERKLWNVKIQLRLRLNGPFFLSPPPPGLPA